MFKTLKTKKLGCGIQDQTQLQLSLQQVIILQVCMIQWVFLNNERKNNNN